jgi:hypothetical protein
MFGGGSDGGQYGSSSTTNGYNHLKNSRLDSLDFLEELRDEIASFLTKAHSESDVLKYLGGQLVYSRPAYLDAEKWSVPVPNNIYVQNPIAAAQHNAATALFTSKPFFFRNY